MQIKKDNINLKNILKISEKDLRQIIQESLENVMCEINSEKSVTFRNIHDDYKKILNEEYGIREKTVIATNEIVEKIRNTFKVNSKIETDNYGIKHYIGKLPYTFDGFDITVMYDIINLINEEIFNKFVGFYAFDSEYNNKRKELSLNICMVNGGLLVDTIINSIQHELSHIFDGLKQNSIIIPDKEIKLYKMAIQQAENPISNESQELARAIYISFKTEQIAMCNGLDASLRSNNEANFDITKTDEYYFLYNLKHVINNIANYKDLIGKIYHMTIEKMLKRLTKAYYDYLRRLSRIEIKYKNNLI